MVHDGGKSQQFLLRSLLSPTNDETYAEPYTAREEDCDDVRLDKGDSREAYLLCGLVDCGHTHRHEPDPQGPTDWRLLRHLMSKDGAPKNVEKTDRVRCDADHSYD